MQTCRSSLSAQMLAQCTSCGEQRLVPHSCGHRSCPHCQHFESQRWIERQTQALLPGTYFLITFTLPWFALMGGFISGLRNNLRKSNN